MRLVSLLMPFLRLGARLIHRLRFEGWDLVPREIGPEGLIVVANHTSGTDPVLAQLRVGATIRWMMDRTQMVWPTGWFWRRLRVIPIDFGPGDSSAFREALGHLRQGGVLGLFPEGGIERPPGQIRPFQAGAGALVARSRAPVLLLWIHGGPKTPSVFRSLFTLSRSVVTVVGLYRFDSSSMTGAEGTSDARTVRSASARTRAIVEHLRSELARASGWPLNDEPLPHFARDARAAVDRRESHIAPP